MAHRTLVALLLGLLSLAGGCTQRDPDLDIDGLEKVPFDGLATLDTTKLTFCCDPNGLFPQVVGTITLTTDVANANGVSVTGDLHVSEPAVEYLDGNGKPTVGFDFASTIVKTYTVYADACPPPTGWSIGVSVVDGFGHYGVSEVPIENVCPPAGEPPVELACGIPDQIWRTEGPIVNVTTAEDVLVVGTDEGACDGTVADGLDPIFGPFSSALYGACLLRHLPSSTEAALGYGSNGIALRAFDGDWEYTTVDPATGDRNTTDAIPTADDPDSAEAIITRNGFNQVQILSYDATTSYFTSVVSLGAHLFPGAQGKMISAIRPEVGGPVYVLFNSDNSQLYVKDDPLDTTTPATLVTTLGADGRRIRCRGIEALGRADPGDLFWATSFVEDNLAVLKPGATPPIVQTVTVGDGPIGIDTKTLPNDDIAVLTTGYNDHTFTITIFRADGTLVSSTTKAVPSGGQNPGGGVFLEDGKVAISCNGSGNIIVFEPE